MEQISHHSNQTLHVYILPYITILMPMLWFGKCMMVECTFYNKMFSPFYYFYISI